MTLAHTNDRDTTSLDRIRQIKRWFELAVPAPTEQNIHSQLGVHFEEVGEMLDVLKEAGQSYSMREQLSFVADAVGFAQRRLKEGRQGIAISLRDLDRVELLDALCDQIVTAVGVAHMLDLDIEGALKEVADSNDSKFDDEGRPIFNEQLKIMKGPNYFRPDLVKYIPQIRV